MNDILCKTCGGSGCGETMIYPDCPDTCTDCHGTGRSDVCGFCNGLVYGDLYGSKCHCYNGFTTDPNELKGISIPFEDIKVGDAVIDDDNCIGCVKTVENINNIVVTYPNNGLGFYCLDPNCNEHVNHEAEKLFKLDTRNISGI